MSAEEKRVCEVSGEQGGGSREPKQDSDRGAESVERTLLSKRRLNAHHG